MFGTLLHGHSHHHTLSKHRTISGLDRILEMQLPGAGKQHQWQMILIIIIIIIFNTYIALLFIKYSKAHYNIIN